MARLSATEPAPVSAPSSSPSATESATEDGATSAEGESVRGSVETTKNGDAEARLPQRLAKNGPESVDSMPSSPIAVNRRQASASNRTNRKRQAKEDRDLVEKAQAGDRQAFQKLVERHQRRAFAVAIGMVRDEQDAREVVQEAFLRVHRNLHKFHGKSSFFTWLYRIVSNLCIDHMRKPARREATLFDGTQISDQSPGPTFLARIDGSNPLDVARRKEIAARIQKELENLPPYHRSVIIMREVEGMSYGEIATALKVSKGTIMSRIFHARQKLQRALADCYREQYGRDPVGRRGS